MLLLMEGGASVEHRFTTQWTHSCSDEASHTAAVTQPRRPQAQTSHTGRSRQVTVPAGLLAPLVACGIVIAMGIVAVLMVISAGAMAQQYATRIYPGVTVGDLAVGGLTKSDAAAFVEQQYGRKIAIFELPDGDQWVARWPELGVTVDATEAVQRAFTVGRRGDAGARVQSWLNARNIKPFLAFDASAARTFLEAHAAELCEPPHNADVSIQDGVAAAVPATPGCEPDIEATFVSLYGHMIREESIPVKTRKVFPVVVDPNPAVEQINQWLSRQFTLNLWWNDGVTPRAVLPRERMAWMQTAVEPRGLVAQLSQEGIRHFLAEVNLELGPAADIRLDEAAGLIRAAMLRGDPSVWLVAPRKQLVHVVEPGDTFDALSDRYGIPSPRLIAANPEAQENGLAVGQQIVIPAQSTMLPLTISSDNLKHIEIDLSEQRLFAYEGATLVLSASISSGIPKWRTLTGIFQVQDKVDEAYNTLAHVRMPNWLSIYELAEPGSTSNGIHALPILQSGKRLWDGYLGQPVSFGCIVMGVKDSAFIYEWADAGTPVVIYGTTPPSTLNYDNLVEAQRAAQ